ncbi:hypothetical protein JCM16814_31380 [Desulfobaculum senezii]
MAPIDMNALATIAFDITWESAEARHRERFLGRKVNLWRDIFPPGLKEALMGKDIGESAHIHYAPGEAVADRTDNLVFDLRPDDFCPRMFGGRTVQARFGRFYPSGLLRNVPGVFPQTVSPFRITALTEGRLVADRNAPFAGREFTLSATVLNAAEKASDTGGRLTDWIEEICLSGPGMQVRCEGGPTDFAASACGDFDRVDAAPDEEFYETTRLVGHVDAQASLFLQEEYSHHLRPGMRVLDLMSSVQSHVPSSLGLDMVGLGLNSEEMRANPALGDHVVHDVNRTPSLPFASGEFDAVLLSLSFEYVTEPDKVVREIARVLRPGGVALLGCSNRWFPTKVVAIWRELHEFERVGYILHYLQKAGVFADMQTVSVRNWWRPEDDPHIRETWTSDPVYVVSAIRV